MLRFVRLLGLLGVFALGCSEGEQPPSKGEAAQESVPTEDVRGSLIGRWMLVASPLDGVKVQDVNLAIVEISSAQEGELSAAVLDSSTNSFPDAKVGLAEFDQASVHLLFELPEQARLDFRGTLQDGVIRGNTPISSGLTPARLISTKADRLPETESQPSEGKETFIAALESDDRDASLTSFVKQYPDSPLALIAYDLLVSRLKDAELDESAVTQIVDEYFKVARGWGARLERISRMKVANTLAMQKFLPGLVVRILEKLESGLPSEESKELAPIITHIKALAQIESQDGLQRQAGEKALRKLHAENPHNHMFRFALAEYTEKQGNAADALELYAGLVVLPDVESLLVSEWRAAGVENTLPSETVARLWKEKHGNADGLDAWLDEAFKSVVHQIAKKPDETSDSLGNRVALVELFTGSQCPPCVAADLAATALEATWSKSHLIVLRYHEHVPGPDPLSNADSEARFGYYDGRGTPTVSLNGKLVEGAGGYVIHSQMVYDLLRQQVAPELTQKTDISLELSAIAKDGKLSLSAQVGGLKEISENLRLRLVLAEDEVSYQARNGIRLHEMLVRVMPTGPEGVSQDNGELKFAQTIELSQLKQKLIDYLSTYERQYVQHGIPSLFPVKPLELDKLHLVAFVQDDQTREVLQAAAIPVSGKLEYPTGPIEAPRPVSGTKPAVKPGAQDSGGPKLIPPGTGSK